MWHGTVGIIFASALCPTLAWSQQRDRTDSASAPQADRSDDPPRVIDPVRPRMPSIRVSDDGSRFVRGGTDEPFVVWGVNYDHDGQGRLIEDYWQREWGTVAEDFAEIKSLGANVVRVHLQLGKFMSQPDLPNDAHLERLGRLLDLAERTGLYLDLTGLGCYHRDDVPAWYDQLSESERWDVQARFWGAVAEVCKDRPCVFCYDLMNEPILAGKSPESDWLAGELAGKHFVQRITLDLGERSREAVAAAWIDRLTDAIASVDDRHLITVGVIPWALTFKNAKPLFYAPGVGDRLDFVSVHFYPRKGDVAGSLEALRVYELGKPLVVEEIFPLKASLAETAEFIEKSKPWADGWISFYWGRTVSQYREQGDLAGQIIADWLDWFSSHAP